MKAKLLCLYRIHVPRQRKPAMGAWTKAHHFLYEGEPGYEGFPHGFKMLSIPTWSGTRKLLACRLGKMGVEVQVPAPLLHGGRTVPRRADPSAEIGGK